MKNVLGMLSLALAAACFLPSAAASQQLREDGGDGGACTFACGCNEAACTCSKTGGRGGSCRTDGYVCSVFRCVGSISTAGDILAYAADGSLVVMSERRGDAAAVSREPRVVRAVRWSPAGPGHLVGVSCEDLVVAEFFDVEAAAASRERMRMMTL